MTDSAAPLGAPSQETCSVLDKGRRCPGVRLDDADRCLAHVEQSMRTAIFQRLADGALLTFARGVPFTTELLADLLAAAPTGENDMPVLRDADFTGVRFQDDAEFRGVRFQGKAEFYGARFQGEANFGGALFEGATTFRAARFHDIVLFNGARFQGVVGFSKAQFRGLASFDEASFEASSWFDGARFEAAAGFDWVTFEGAAGFGGAVFEGRAGFNDARFHDQVWFDRAIFHGDTWFRDMLIQNDAGFSEAIFHARANFIRARFEGDTKFDGPRFEGDAEFDAASFQGSTHFGPLSVTGVLGLRQAVFTQLERFEVTAATVIGEHMRLEGGGGTIGLSDPAGGALLDGAVLTHPITVASVGDPATADAAGHQSTTSSPSRWSWDRRARPKVLGIRGVDAGNLVLTDLDLGVCQVTGAHHLDQLRIEGPAAFADTPRGWKATWGWPLIWRWSRRQVLVEERAWRKTDERGARQLDWLPADDDGLALLRKHEMEVPSVLGPERVAGLYRALRKAQEDAKNEPGAADFYYGEMEMRRYAVSTPWAERTILGLYWLAAGYALRAWRALLTLLVILLAASGLLLLWGLPQSAVSDGGRGASGVLRPSGAEQRLEVTLRNPDTKVPRIAIRDRLAWSRWWRSLWVSANAAVFRSAEPTLTVVGRITEMCTRVLGPVLFGLALLSIRNRVKR